MKTTNKLILVFAFSLFLFNSNAQTTFAIKGGLNISKMYFKEGKIILTDSDEFSSKLGMNLGLFADIPLNDFLSIEPGVIYSNKGFLYELEEDDTYLKSQMNLHYIDIPIAIKAKQRLNDNIKLFGSVGLYLGIGVGGKNKYEAEIQFLGIKEKESGSEEISWGNSESDDLKRTDMGLNFGTGIEFNKISFEVFYDLGLSNLTPSDIAENSPDEVLKNRVWRLSFGYKLKQ